MDAPRLFHPGYGPVIPRPPPPPIFQRRPPLPQRDDDNDAGSHRIAHTLTACCRCRQVRPLLLGAPRPPALFAPVRVVPLPAAVSRRRLRRRGGNPLRVPRRRFVLTETSPLRRERRGAIPPCPAASPANGRGPSASTSTPPRGRRSNGTMSSSCRTRCGSSRWSSRSIPTTTSSPRAPRISSGRAALSGSTRRTRRRAISGPAAESP